jgi:hypothetical protein
MKDILIIKNHLLNNQIEKIDKICRHWFIIMSFIMMKMKMKNYMNDEKIDWRQVSTALYTKFYTDYSNVMNIFKSHSYELTGNYNK